MRDITIAAPGSPQPRRAISAIRLAAHAFECLLQAERQRLRRDTISTSQHPLLDPAVRLIRRGPAIDHQRQTRNQADSSRFVRRGRSAAGLPVIEFRRRQDTVTVIFGHENFLSAVDRSRPLMAASLENTYPLPCVRLYEGIRAEAPPRLKNRRAAPSAFDSVPYSSPTRHTCRAGALGPRRCRKTTLRLIVMRSASNPDNPLEDTILPEPKALFENSMRQLGVRFVQP